MATFLLRSENAESSLPRAFAAVDRTGRFFVFEAHSGRVCGPAYASPGLAAKSQSFHSSASLAKVAGQGVDRDGSRIVDRPPPNAQASEAGPSLRRRRWPCFPVMVLFRTAAVPML